MLSLLSVPSLHIQKYSFCLSHFSLKGSLSGALSKIWNRIDFMSCLFSLQCFVMGLCLSDKCSDALNMNCLVV